MNGALLLARAVLALHAAFAAFVVLGLFLTAAGELLRWRWVRNPVYRLSHLAAIGYVVLRVWSGVPCFLTNAEIRLRDRAGIAAEAGRYDRIGQTLVFRGADPKGFRRAATAWGALTLLAFFAPFIRSRARRGAFGSHAIPSGP